jgi:hypothetical protein
MGPRLTPVPTRAYMPVMRAGRMAEWLCRGLQILVQRFDSASGLQRRRRRERASLIPGSSVGRASGC